MTPQKYKGLNAIEQEDYDEWVDDMIEEWHTTFDPQQLSLIKFLGMDREMYNFWVEKG
jgi:hypothetical protein